jgi:tetratricopeptide (TPR) repeat protein
MKATLRSNEITTRFFGVFRGIVDDRGTRRWEIVPLRLVLVLTLGLIGLYAVGVGCGYFWLQKVKNFPQVGVMDVAMLRWRAIRRDIAKEQFAAAERDWKEEKMQPAFLSFITAVRNDPDNVAGRIKTADFYVATGSAARAPDLLEEGLKRSSRNRALMEKTLDLLTTIGRDREALTVIREMLRDELNGPNRAMLRSYEVLATLNLDGVAAAKTLLEQHPEVNDYAGSAHTRAQIAWESRDRMHAIEILTTSLQQEKTLYANYALLAQYQESAGMSSDARDTAFAAVRNLPHEMGSHILLIALLDPNSGADAASWKTAVSNYLTEFGDTPGAIPALAEVASRKGWSDFVRGLYQIQLVRGREVRLIGLYYADALVAQNRPDDANQVLSDLALQFPDRGPLALLLWQRQVEVASALGLDDDAREAARRLGTALSQDPDRLRMIRRRFDRMGLKDASTELERMARAGTTTMAKR